MKTRISKFALFGLFIVVASLSIFSFYPGSIQAENLNAPVLYSGRFMNSGTATGGSLTLNIDIGTDTVSGYIDFTNDSHVGPLCGAQNFTGTRIGNTIQFSFVSQDPDPDCSEQQGYVFEVTGTLSDSPPVIFGTYVVDDFDSGQQGVFSVSPANLCDSVTEIPRVECEALVALYNSTGGQNWDYRTGWLENDRPCNRGWQGVDCTDGHVTDLHLGWNDLSGNIPPQIGDLSYLETLDLSFNSLKGLPPPELGNLSNLRELDIIGNQLSGNIPYQLGSLSNLVELGLSGNQFEGEIPHQLENLSNLQRLYLANNQLSGNMPHQLGNILSLEELDLSENQLSGDIPYQLENLSNLQILRLGWNQLSGGIPHQLGNILSLQELDIGSNQLTGEIPSQLENLSNLQYLELTNNQLSGGIPHQLGYLTNLQTLGLGVNQLDGTIPYQLGNLSDLQYLNLYNNRLTGGIPSELGNLSNLTTIYLGWNQLSGPIPTQLGDLSSLQLLDLEYNHQLNGALPGSLANLTSLDTFWFSNTNLCIPTDAAFQSWLDGIDYLETSGISCGSGGVDLSIDSVTPVQVLEGQALVKDKATAVKVVVRKSGEGAAYDVPVQVVVNSATSSEFYVAELDNLDGDTFELRNNNYSYPLNFATDEVTKIIYFFSDNFAPTDGFEAIASVDYTDGIMETDETNNTLPSPSYLAYDVKWSGRWFPELHLQFYRTNWDDPSSAAFEDFRQASSDFVQSVYPVSDQDFIVGGSSELTIPISRYDENGNGLLNGTETCQWLPANFLGMVFDHPTADIFVKVVPKDWFLANTGSSTGGISCPNNREIIVVEARPDFPLILAHELGHTYGLGLPCEEYDENCDGKWDRIGVSASLGLWVARKIPIESSLSRPIYNFMGSADSTVEYWTNIDSYNRLLDEHKVSISANSITSAAAPQAIVAVGNFSITGTVTLDNWYVLPDAELSTLTPGPYVFDYQDANGESLYQQSFDISYDFQGNILERVPFSYRIPYIPNVAKIIVKHNASTLATKSISQNSPTILLTKPNGDEQISGETTISWSGDDLDGDELAYAILVSLDGGETWNTIATGLTKTNYVWDTSDIPSGTEYLIKVIVTDGFNTTQDVSDQPFAVANGEEIYLPLILKNSGPPPDLMATLSLDPPNPAAGQAVTVEVVVTNVGDSPTRDGFWVDFYVDPDPVPTASNQNWDRLGSNVSPMQGIAWVVPAPGLDVGESVTLTSNGIGGLAPSSSHAVWADVFFSGTQHLYVYIDSFSVDGSPTGAIFERNEANNRAELHFSSALGGAEVVGPNGVQEPVELPSRSDP